MWKILATFVLFFLVSATSCDPASALVKGTLALPRAVTTCNINTGIATGLDAGTCASPHAVCDGVTDNSTAFIAFNTWAKATTTNANGQLLELDVSGICNFTSGNAATFTGLKNARLMGYGATLLSTTGNEPALGPAGGSQPAGICHKGLSDPSGCSARIATVSAGANSVTLLNTSLCSRFTAGQWAVVTGFDLQGTFNDPFGYPPNPHFFDYVQIASTASCAGTGQITFNSSLAYSYLSTWANYNAGNGSEADAGGPATIYALDPNWGGSVDIRGVTIDSPNQSIYQGLSVSLLDVTMTGSNCVIPSQNGTFTMTNVTGLSCAIEIDKIIGTLTYNNVSFARLNFQSSSTNLLNINGATLSTDLNGTPKVAIISNLTTPTMRIGPTAFGVPTSVSCSNCVVTDQIQSFGLTEKGPGDTVGANNFYSASGGVFSFPNAVNVTGFANNGSGLIRLTVSPNTTGWVTNAAPGITGIFATCPGNCPAGDYITVIDSTHIDLQSESFSSYTWTGAGQLVFGAAQQRWAVPGTNIFPSGQFQASTPAFQVTGVTQDASGTHIATSLAGGYPTIPLTGGGTIGDFEVQGLKFTCSPCSGNAQFVDFSGAPSNIPIFSYSKRSYVNATSLVNSNLWGTVTSIKINVAQAYTGSTTPLTFTFSESGVLPNGTGSGWGGTINLRQAGLRTITGSGVTCDTGGGPVAGGCSGDGTLTLPDPNLMFASTMNLSESATPSDQPWAMTAEFVMNQGVH